MSGNTFGQHFTLTTFGESHGPALGAIVDGCPPGMALSEADIQPGPRSPPPGAIQVHHPAPGKRPGENPLGVFEGRTTGTPIGLAIENEDPKSKDYDDIKNLFRPAHADFTYHHKYGLRDYRGSGRASAGRRRCGWPPAPSPRSVLANWPGSR